MNLEDSHLKSHLSADLFNSLSNPKKKILNNVMNKEIRNIRIIIKIKLDYSILKKEVEIILKN